MASVKKVKVCIHCKRIHTNMQINSCVNCGEQHLQEVRVKEEHKEYRPIGLLMGEKVYGEFFKYETKELWIKEVV